MKKPLEDYLEIGEHINKINKKIIKRQWLYPYLLDILLSFYLKEYKGGVNMYEDLDLLIKSGENQYHVVFIYLDDEQKIVAKEPHCHFTKDRVLFAYDYVSRLNVNCSLKEFDSWSDAILHYTKNTKTVNDVLDINIHKAVELNEEFVVYSRVQLES